MKKYEYTKSIGFRLIGNISELSPNKTVHNLALKDYQSSFLQLYKDAIEQYKELFLYETKDKLLRASKFVSIKYPFLKLHGKEYYYSQSKKRKIYTIKEDSFLHNLLVGWYEANNELFNLIQNNILTEQEAQKSRSDILYLIKKFYTPEYIFFLRDLLQYSNHKKEGEKMQRLMYVTDQLLKVTDVLLYHLAPNQKSGVEVACGTFNYYTLNKTAKDFPKEISKIEDLINTPFRLTDEDKKFLHDIKLLDQNVNDCSLIDLYSKIKDFKSRQKSNFIQDVQSDKLTTQNFAQRYPLFKTKPDIFYQFYELTKQLNKATGKEARTIAKKRGRYFQNARFGFANYVRLSNLFKRIAMQLGRLKAELRSLKQEQVDARLLKYWGFILLDGKNKKLVLIPKERRADVMRDLRSGTNGNLTLLEFNSITLRALEKMIRKEYQMDIPKMNEDEQFFIKRIKDALSNNLDKIDLSLSLSPFKSAIQEITQTNHESKDELRKHISKKLYTIIEHTISENDLKKWDALIYDISSYDLERNLQSEQKEHTRIWERFWSNTNKKDNYKLRLNPEFRIFYRDTIKQDDPYQKKTRNRFSTPQVRVQFSFTENVGAEDFNVSFLDGEKLFDYIDRFNKDVIYAWVAQNENKNNLWYYGIDRGNQELATLGVVRWTRDKYKVLVKNGKIEFNKPEFAQIPVYKIKNPTDTIKKQFGKNTEQKEIKIIDNPSYFMQSDKDIEKYFIKEIASFIDLTTAKLIKGKIVLDGDIKTYLNLKKANAKRKLYNSIAFIDANAKVEYVDESHLAWKIKDKKNRFLMRHAFVVKNKDIERSRYTLLCYFTPEQEKKFGTKTKDDLLFDLQEHLDELRRDPKLQAHSIEQINNLRDAITANMVGIIAYLFEKYPGFINLENLQEEINIHFESNNENIARRLEWALYRKFQKKGLVPPRLKNTIFLRKEKKIKQFGIIHFVKTEGTSGVCPRCLTKANKYARMHEKWVEHQFTCTNNYCGFSTGKNRKEFDQVKNSDDVAAYNIANPVFEKYVI